MAAVVVLDRATSYLYAPLPALAQWGVSEGVLFDQAIQNLALHTRGELRATGGGSERLLFVGELDGYDAVRLRSAALPHLALVLEVWADGRIVAVSSPGP